MLFYICTDKESFLTAADEDARIQLHEHAPNYRHSIAPSTAKLARRVELHVVPSLEGFRFNPRSLTVTWEQDVQRHTFQMRAETASPSETMSGNVYVFSGPLLRAEIPISLHVEGSSQSSQMETPAGDNTAIIGRPYRSVFVSYSHRDTHIVRACTTVSELIGDRVMIDTKMLRSGEKWSERLKTMIDDADILQLFWSRRAARSPYVEQEWRYALSGSSGEPKPVRPVYWTPHPYTIPPELEPLHFVQLDLRQLGWGPLRRFSARMFSC
jgi:TIR domain